MTPAIITLTLTGASHLVGFSGFSLLEVRRCKLDRSGALVLRGPFFAQPPIGTPTSFNLNLDRGAKALLVRGTAYDRLNSLFLPLIHEPGSRLEIPLSAPPPLSARSLLRLAQLFRAAPWIEAVTYRGTGAEHEYSRRSTWANEADFVWAATMIARHGYRNFFRRAWWVQLDIDGYTYWTGWQEPSAHLWINRRPLDRPAVPHRVRQVLVAEDARLLEVPDARALALELFPEAGR